MHQPGERSTTEDSDEIEQNVGRHAGYQVRANQPRWIERCTCQWPTKKDATCQRKSNSDCRYVACLAVYRRLINCAHQEEGQNGLDQHGLNATNIGVQAMLIEAI